MKARGFADPVTLVLVAGLGLGFVLGSWKPLGYFKKKPETAQLTKLQGELEAAQAAAKQANADKETAVKEERAKLEEQVREAQADNLGTETALKKVPSDHQTPEVKLASRMAARVSLKLSVAIGRLPQDQQIAMVELIDQLLSEKQAEVDEANRKLAQLDKEFRVLSDDRAKLVAQIPVLEEKALKADETAQIAQARVTAKTEEVKKWAEKTDAAMRENGSLTQSIERGLLLLGGAYLLITVVLPGLIKHLSSDNPLKGPLRDVAGYFASPLLYHDAKKKLKEKDEADGRP